MLSLSTVLLIIVITVLVRITFLGDKASTTFPDTTQSTDEEPSTPSNKLVEPLTDAPNSNFKPSWSITPPRPRAATSSPVHRSRIPRRRIDRVLTTLSYCIPNPSEDSLCPISDDDDCNSTSSDSSDTSPSPPSSRSSLSPVAAANATDDVFPVGRTKERKALLEQELTNALQKLESTEKRLEHSERTTSKLRNKLQAGVSDLRAKKQFEEQVLDSRRVEDKHVAEKVKLQNNIRGLESEVAKLKMDASRWQNFQREAMKQVQRRRLALRLAAEAVSAVAQYQLVRMKKDWEKEKQGWEKDKQGWNQQSEKLQRTVAREKQRADTQTSHHESLETAYATLMKKCSEQDAMIHKMNVQVEVANRERKVIEDESKSLRNEVMKLTKAINEQAGSILARSSGYDETNSHLAVVPEPMFMPSPQAAIYHRVEEPVTNLTRSFAPAHPQVPYHNLSAQEPTPDFVPSFNNAGSSQSQPLHHLSAQEPTPDFMSSFNASSCQPVRNVQTEQPIPEFVPAFNGGRAQPRPSVVPIAENPFLKAPADDFAAGPSCEATRPSPVVNTFFATPPSAPVAPSSSLPTPLPFSIGESAAPVPPLLPTLGNDWTKVEPEPESKEERLQRALERMKQNSESAQASYGKQGDRRARNAKRMGKR